MTDSQLFALGLIGGTAVSLVVWPAAMRWADGGSVWGMVGAMFVVKGSVALGFWCTSGKYMAGIGVLGSMGLGTLILFASYLQKILG